jgi:predicted HicB family RNase H-like nuclease
MNTKHYSYRVTWSAEDGEYVGTVAELPSLSWLAPKQSDALRGIVDLARSVVADLTERGEPVPQAIAERTYSGRFNVRVPSSLHRELALAAAEQRISLNRLVSDRLAHAS